MAMTTSDGNVEFLPEEAGALIVQPALDASVAAQVLTVVRTAAHTYRIPVVSEDPMANWFDEGEAITPDDMAFDEVVVTPAKVAGLTRISRELAEDTNPAAAQVVGAGLARDIGRTIDQALFGTMTAPAPDGLTSTAATFVDSNGFANIDPFVEAMFAAENLGAQVDAWVTTPAVALALAKLKEATGSLRHLLQPDPTAPTGRTIAGVPLYVSSYVDTGVCWGIPKDRSQLVLRDDVRLEVDRSVYFATDEVAIKATMRVGFGLAHEAAIIRIADEAVSS